MSTIFPGMELSFVDVNQSVSSNNSVQSTAIYTVPDSKTATIWTPIVYNGGSGVTVAGSTGVNLTVQRFNSNTSTWFNVWENWGYFDNGETISASTAYNFVKSNLTNSPQVSNPATLMEGPYIETPSAMQTPTRLILPPKHRVLATYRTNASTTLYFLLSVMEAS